MRRAVAVAVAVVTWVAMLAVSAAEQARYGGGAAAGGSTFWQGILDPNAQEVARLVTEGRILRDQVAQNYVEPHLVQQRLQVLADALARFERAASLSPRDPKVARECGITALDAGDHAKAVQWFLTFREIVGDERDFTVSYNLAEAYVHLGRFEEARRVLERALPDAAGLDRNRGLVLFGYVHMAAGRLEDAIDAYQRALTAGPSPYGWGPDHLALLGLAVAYDRDEQISRAREVLDQARQLDPTFNVLVYTYALSSALPPSQRHSLVFSPPSDRHYWLALAYEAQGRLPEAASEWRAYVESVDPAYKHRAEEHLKEIRATLAQRGRGTTAAPARPPRKPRPAAASGGRGGTP